MSEIISLSAHALAEGIRKKHFSCEEVMRAHLARIKAINPSINAVTQIDEEKALHHAKEADRQLLIGKVHGPLHGVPFTVKEVIETKDFFSTAGMQERAQYRAEKDATVVARMRASGAILMAKTNLPEAGSGIGSTNPLFGRTNNPHNLERTPGGSSSGEAALIAAFGSPLGIGSDSGGSIRIPAHCCGVAALKPTTGRIPSTGHFPIIGNVLDPRSQIGPLARTAEDLFIAFKIMQGSDGLDPYVIDMPVHFPQEVHVKELRIAYYTKSGAIHPDEDTSKVLKNVVEGLRASGLHLTEHEPPRLNEVVPISKAYWDFEEKEGSTKEYFQLLKQWDAFRAHMLQFSQGYDAFISPVVTKPAPPHGQLKTEDVVYTLTYSLVGWPCVVVKGGVSKEGLPIGVQIAAKPFREDVALAVAKAIEHLKL